MVAGDRNIICAGRLPNAEDLDAIRQAGAVILPQGCSRQLYEMARRHCPHVFPNYDVRFQYPGKIGQAQLFDATGIPHPATRAYAGTEAFYRRCGRGPWRLPLSFPLVFKFDWGGEGETVFPVSGVEVLEELLEKAERFERSGQAGFLLQEYVPTHNWTLRVVVIGRRMVSYWRSQRRPDVFGASLARGAEIDPAAWPRRQENGRRLVERFCRQTGVNLAGFDLLFSSKADDARPLMLEINYFFGRRGLGGSEAYYRMLQAEIDHWLQECELAARPGALRTGS